MRKQLKFDRRRFLGVAAMPLAASELVLTGSSKATSDNITFVESTSINPILNHSFEKIQINAGVSNIGYAEEGSEIILQGFFYTAGLRHSEFC